MKKLLFLLSGVILAFSNATAVWGISLTRNGQSDYAIISAPDAILAEKTAAQELKEHIQKISGVNIPVLNQNTGNFKQILIGTSSSIKKLLPEVDFSKLAADEIIIRTVGDKLILSGGRPRGSLYAVYVFLEDILGVRWWTAKASYIPEIKNINLPAINIHYAPQFKMRTVFAYDIWRDQAFASRMKNNGTLTKVSNQFGGHLKIINWCHSFDKLIPAKKYLKLHPDWFSLVKGKRVGGQSMGQLCLTNDAMRHEFTKLVLAQLRAEKKTHFISISQNDNPNYCQCPKCTAVNQAFKSPSGSLIEFVNHIAAAVEKEFPETMVTTLAYFYTLKPPVNLRPRHNVVMRLCSIQSDFSKALNSAYNKEFRDALVAWSKISKQIFVWNYTTNFSRFTIPYPNITNLANDIRFFAKHKVTGIFEQDTLQARSGYFTKLKVWLLSKLMWNPQLSQETLINEFMHGYYGKASPYLKKILYMLEEEMQKSGTELRFQEHNTGAWLKLDALNKVTSLFNQALEVVKNDPVLSKRVIGTKLAIDNVWIWRGKFLRQHARKNKKTYNGPDDLKAFKQKFFKNAENCEILNYRETKPLSYYMSLLKKRASIETELEPPLPPELKKMSGKLWYDIQPGCFNLFLYTQPYSLEDDPTASNGKAISLPGNSKQWSIQFWPSYSVFNNASWQIFVMARCDADQLEGNAMRIGVYDAGKKRCIEKSMYCSVKELNGKKYKLVSFGEFKTGYKKYLWICSQGNKNVKKLWIDRIIAVKQ